MPWCGMDAAGGLRATIHPEGSAAGLAAESGGLSIETNRGPLRHAYYG